MNKNSFESYFRVLSQVGYADAERLYAFNSSPAAQEDQDSNSVLDEIRRAQERLEADPTLFSGDPDGVFTYEDPILAAGSLWAHAGPASASTVGEAGDGSELSNSAILRWIKTGIYAWLSRGDKAFVTLGGRTPSQPIMIDKEHVRFAVVGDAGYRGHAQDKVIRYISRRHGESNFDRVIHLGDVYFSGSGQEMLRNFLGPFSTIGAGVLTLVGNHDLYYGADGYSEALNVLRQPGRYFCIETPRWRLICLDTSLAAERLLRNEGYLDDGQLRWLDHLLSAGDGKRVILLSHHYIVSGWGSVSDTLGNQLRDRIKEYKNVCAWYWGHEHGCVTYDRDDLGVFGACVGNGAFLEEWKPPHLSPSPSWYAKGRCTCYNAGGSKFWPHGYLELELTPDKIIENYHLEAGETHQRILPV